MAFILLFRIVSANVEQLFTIALPLKSSNSIKRAMSHVPLDRLQAFDRIHGKRLYICADEKMLVSCAGRVHFRDKFILLIHNTSRIIFSVTF